MSTYYLSTAAAFPPTAFTVELILASGAFDAVAGLWAAAYLEAISLVVDLITLGATGFALGAPPA